MTDEETRRWLRELFGDEPQEPETNPPKKKKKADDDAELRQWAGELFDRAKNQD